MKMSGHFRASFPEKNAPEISHQFPWRLPHAISGEKLHGSPSASLAEIQGSVVYPYPSVSDLAEGNSDHGPSKTWTKLRPLQTLFLPWIGETQTMFWGGKLRPWSDFGFSFGEGVDKGARRD